MKIDDIKEEFESINKDTKFEDYQLVLRFRCVQFCEWILAITDPELKKIKDPQVLFDKYLKSL